MTPHALDLIRAAAWHFKMEPPVLEIGSYIEANQDHLDMRQAFPHGARYFGCDVNHGPGVDGIVDALDEEALLSAGNMMQPKTILCLYVLEHVWDIRQLARNLGALRRAHPESWLWVSTHQNQPFHGTKDYPDFWRVTAEGMRRLMREDAGIGDAHILVYPSAPNPEDVVAVRQPASVELTATTLEKLVAACRDSWSWYC